MKWLIIFLDFLFIRTFDVYSMAAIFKLSLIHGFIKKIMQGFVFVVKHTYIIYCLVPGIAFINGPEASYLRLHGHLFIYVQSLSLFFVSIDFIFVKKLIGKLLSYVVLISKPFFSWISPFLVLNSFPKSLASLAFWRDNGCRQMIYINYIMINHWRQISFLPNCWLLKVIFEHISMLLCVMITKSYAIKWCFLVIIVAFI